MAKSNIHFLFNAVSNWLDNIPEDTHEEYLGKLDRYKDIIDRTPNKFLNFHLKDSIQKEHYELAAYIKEVAENRGFKLKQPIQ